MSNILASGLGNICSNKMAPSKRGSQTEVFEQQAFNRVETEGSAPRCLKPRDAGCVALLLAITGMLRFLLGFDDVQGVRL